MKFNRELLQILSPYGEWSHPRGMQVVDYESARRMQRNMGIFRPFGSIPVYIGHPDDHPDGEKVPVGKVVKIFPICDAIAVVARYCDGIFEKIISREISAMSPRWQMERLSDGRYRPVRLLSVGLTNNPNIPSSGTIISVSHLCEELSECFGLAMRTLERFKAANAIANECSKKLGSLAGYVKCGAVEARASGRANAFPAARKSALEISELARQRSIRTGEPYTKSFAALKKTIS